MSGLIIRFMHLLRSFFLSGGGAGINIEPQHGFYVKLRKDRLHDISIEAGVSSEKGELTLFGREGSQAASFAERGGLNTGSQQRKVPVITLGDICRQYFTPQDDIHFLKIDVEGWEKQCLEGMDFHYIKPWILCIESSGADDPRPAHLRWEAIIHNAGYEFALQYRVNRFYVSKEHLELKKSFLNPEKLRKIYNVTKYTDFKINEKCENALCKMRSCSFLKPVRFLYNWYKNRMIKW